MRKREKVRRVSICAREKKKRMSVCERIRERERDRYVVFVCVCERE